MDSMTQSPPPINAAGPDDGIDLKRIWNLLGRNRFFIAAAAGIVAGGAVAYTVWAVPVPVSPRGLFNLLFGLGLGLMAGGGVAFLRERLDDTVHTGEDLREASGGVTLMTVVPRIRSENGHNGRSASRPHNAQRIGDHLIAGVDPGSWASEAYRGLRTNIMFANPDQPPTTLVFTSALPRDGKSISATNFAITLAQLGRRALLVDADMRHGCLHDVFGVPRDPGLTEILTGENFSNEAIHTIDLGDTIDLGEKSGTLFFMPTGTLPPNPTELLGSARMKGLLKSLKAQFDAVILDCPPLMAVTDAAILGTYADATLLVARANVTEKGAITHCMEQLKDVRTGVLGTILNDVDPKRDSRYGEPYGMYEALSKKSRGTGTRRASDRAGDAAAGDAASDRSGVRARDHRWGAPRPSEPPRPEPPRPQSSQPQSPEPPLHPAVRTW